MPPENNRKILLSTRIMRGLSGKVILIKHNILALKAAGWEVSLFAEKFDEKLLAELDINAIGIWNKAFTKAYKLKRFLNKHERLAREGGFDLVVGHGETLFQDVLHIHNFRHGEYALINNKELQDRQKATADLQARQIKEQCYRRLVANSRLMKNDFVHRFGADPDKIDVVYPGYDPQRFFVNRECPESLALRTSINAENHVLIGLITSGKLNQRGADLFIPALSRLPRELQDKIKVVIVARDNIEPFQKQAAETGLDDRIHFMAPRPDVEAFYNALDIYINPARVEAFGMALLEAMACGVPSLTTAGVVGAGELLQGKMSAGLIDGIETDALVQVLQRFIESESLRQNHGRLCAQAALAHDWQSNTRQHIEIYERVLREKLSGNA